MDCKNCGIQLSENQEYCNECGAKVVAARLTFKNIWEELADKFFNIDSTLLQTFKKLFSKPEEVIDGYVNGVRKKYINPISYIAISLTLSGILVFVIKNFYPDVMDYTAMYGQSKSAFSEKYAQFSLDYSSLFYIVMIPGFSCIAWLLFLGKKYNLVEHFVFQAYTSAQYSITSFFFSLVVIVFLNPKAYLYYSLSLFLLWFIYDAYCYKKVFKLSLWGVVWRGFLAIPLAYFFLTMVGVAIIIVLVLTGTLTLADFAPQP